MKQYVIIKHLFNINAGTVEAMTDDLEEAIVFARLSRQMDQKAHYSVYSIMDTY